MLPRDHRLRHAGEIDNLRFVPTPARRFVTVNVETEGDGSDPTEAVIGGTDPTPG